MKLAVASVLLLNVSLAAVDYASAAKTALKSDGAAGEALMFHARGEWSSATEGMADLLGADVDDVILAMEPLVEELPSELRPADFSPESLRALNDQEREGLTAELTRALLAAGRKDIISERLSVVSNEFKKESNNPLAVEQKMTRLERELKAAIVLYSRDGEASILSNKAAAILGIVKQSLYSKHYPARPGTSPSGMTPERTEAIVARMISRISKQLKDRGDVTIDDRTIDQNEHPENFVSGDAPTHLPFLERSKALVPLLTPKIFYDSPGAVVLTPGGGAFAAIPNPNPNRELAKANDHALPREPHASDDHKSVGTNYRSITRLTEFFKPKGELSAHRDKESNSPPVGSSKQTIIVTIGSALLLAGGLLLISTAYHLPGTVLLVIGLALVFDFSNGWHDTANAIATVVSTKAMTPGWAVAMAAALNLAGAFFSTAVAKMIGNGIVHPSIIIGHPYVLPAALAGAILWNLITLMRGLPTSSSHAVIAAMIGAAMVAAGLSAIADGNAVIGGAIGAIHWAGLASIGAAMIICPLAGFTAGYLLIGAINWAVKRMGAALSAKVFSRAQLLSSAYMAFTHGANDAQKAMGIIALALAAGQSVTGIPSWVIWACASAMGLGTAAGGWKIIHTVGSKVTQKQLEPHHGFAAETGAATVLLAAAHFGAPTSTTHTVVSTVAGAGGARWKVLGKIAIAWAFTLPSAAALGALVYLSIIGLNFLF